MVASAVTQPSGGNGVLVAQSEAVQMRNKTREIQNRVVEQMQRKPYAALVLAAGVGFIAGLILKRRL